MQLLAAALEQALIGRVADQRVLEHVAGVGWRAAAEDQLGLDQALHGFGKLGLGQAGKRGDGLMVEVAADDGGGLRHLLDRVQAVEPGHQRIVQRGGDRQLAERAVEQPGVVGLPERAQFEHRLGHLLDIERHAIGARGDLGHQLRRQRLAAGDPGHDRRGRVAAEPVQRQAGDDRVAAEAMGEARPGGGQQQHRCRRHPVEHQLDQLERGRDRPSGRPR